MNSISALTSTQFTSLAESSGTANQFATDLNQVASDLQGGNLSAAQEDYVTLSQDALNAAASSSAETSTSNITTGMLGNIAGSSSSAAAFTNSLNQLGSDLENGDLSSAQSDMLTLDSTALGAASSASATASGTSATIATNNTAEVKELVASAVQAMGAGDNSLAGTILNQLASASPSAAGASYLQSMSASLSGATSASSSVASLIQSDSASSNATSMLSLLA
ncbi:hypothetical protein SAMN05421819_2564 [Bryocella elongata]|uniref:Uncharacterized protein n=1 Tax=Bryocella elongata TaxID=863522 RepID=A0A1H5ZB55_9BACT|nr:hypothetical protein [Bryocella elongata]SEG33618.1 hypothetical protein SAMN05421819_2564 [Bryocella elongata]